MTEPHFVNPFIHPWAFGLPLLAVVNNVDVKIGVHISVCITPF